MQSGFEHAQETLDLLNTEDISEEYLDSLYEIIMKTLADDFEEKKNQHLAHIHSKFQQFVEQQKIIQQQERDEAEKLIQNIDNI